MCCPSLVLRHTARPLVAPFVAASLALYESIIVCDTHIIQPLDAFGRSVRAEKRPLVVAARGGGAPAAKHNSTLSRSRGEERTSECMTATVMSETASENEMGRVSSDRREWRGAALDPTTADRQQLHSLPTSVERRCRLLAARREHPVVGERQSSSVARSTLTGAVDNNTRATGTESGCACGCTCRAAQQRKQAH